MRLFLLPALTLIGLPALAQTGDAPRTEDRDIVIERTGPPGAEPMVRRMIIVNGDTTIEESRGLSAEGRMIRRGDEDHVVIELDGDGPMRWRGAPEGADVIVRRFETDGEGENVFRMRTPGPESEDVFRMRVPGLDGASFLGTGDGPVPSAFRVRRDGMGGGVSAETRERMDTLEREAQGAAREARTSEGSARRDAERRLDAALSELFEVRAQARREAAGHLRTQAAEMQQRADAMEAALAERQARRQALIDARRAELLGAPASDW